MKKKTWKGRSFVRFGLALCVAAVFSFTGCPGDDDGPGGGGYFIPPYRDTTKMTVRWDPLDPLDLREGKDPIRVIHTVWYEPEEDPRQVIGYQLKDRNATPYFDHVTMLYGMRLRYNNCRSQNIRCTETGLHACFGDNSNMRFYIENWETYFKPVRDRGIKVLLSLVPEGGPRVGDLFESSSWTPALQEKYGLYPFNAVEVYQLIDQIADIFNRCQIDGIAFDEEYGGTWKSPDGSQTVDLNSDSKNILRFSYELDQAMKNKHGRQEHLINEFYEWGVPVPASYTFHDRYNVEVTVRRDDQLDYTFSQNYGGFTPNSPAGTLKIHYGPASVAIADTDNAPKPSYGADIESKMWTHLYGSYGVVMYYCLRSRDELKDGIPKWGKAAWDPNMFGSGNAGKPEAYFSKIGQILHGYDVEYVGRDYPRAFQYQ